VQQLARHGGSDIDEQKAVEKYLHIIPKKYSQIALSIETLLDHSTLSIEEVTGRLKAVDDREEAPPANRRRQAAIHRGAMARSLEGDSVEGEEAVGGLVFVQGSSPTTAQEEQ
jgi:hypothetical protein